MADGGADGAQDNCAQTEPEEVDIRGLVRTEVEHAWSLHQALFDERLPRLMRESIIAHDKEQAELEKKVIEKIGMEVGPDGQPRPKGGSVKAFFRKNGTTIGLISLAIVIIRPDLLLVVLRFLLSLWGL